MPPVREPSTKPSAATVLPAPVACSNQKRLPALGSSGAAGSWPSSSSATGSSSQSWGSSGSSSSSSSSSPGDRGRGERRVGRRGGAPAAVRGRRGRLGEQRGQRARERVDLVRVEDRAVGELGLLLAEQPVQAEQERPALAPRDRRDLGARLELRQRVVERAAAGAAGGELGRGILALEHERLAGEGYGALDGVAVGNGRRGLEGHWRGFGHTARCDKGVGAANGTAARLRGCGPGIRGLVCRGTGGLGAPRVPFH